MDLLNGLQPRPVHDVLMTAVLQVLVVTDVLHHLVVRNKVVVLSALLVLLWRSGCVCRTETHTKEMRFYPLWCAVLLWEMSSMRLTRDGVGESVRVFGYERVLDVSPAHSMSTWQDQIQVFS